MPALQAFAERSEIFCDIRFHKKYGGLKRVTKSLMDFVYTLISPELSFGADGI